MDGENNKSNIHIVTVNLIAIETDLSTYKPQTMCFSSINYNVIAQTFAHIGTTNNSKTLHR